MSLNPNQRVKIVRTSSSMDGELGTVIGVSTALPEMTAYIVETDNQVNNGHGDGWKAIAITEHCLVAI